MRKLTFLMAAALVVGVTGCTTTTMTTTDPKIYDPYAERYVRNVLAMGEHDADYVDAYYGPPQWREEVKAQKRTLEQIRGDAIALQAELATLPRPNDRLLALRHDYLLRQTEALLGRLDILSGRKMTFDQESQALYDAVAPHHDEAYFQNLLNDLDRALPPVGATSSGTISERVEAFRKDFVIPKDKLDAVFRKAVEGCRERTLRHIELPPGENFKIEYVTGKSWSGYNWYQGNFNSLIQVNTDLPIYIDRAIDLACHEGYPGHHVYNVLLEKHLVKDRGWQEFTVYALFSPQSLIAEGSANYGIDVAFPGAERVQYERTTLFPLAGLDPSRADQYYRIHELTSKLSYAGNEAARRYLDGQITAGQAADWLTRYALMSPARAAQRVKFIDQYRSYVINYNLGKDLVRRHVEARTGNDPQQRWEEFETLLSSPTLPSGLAK